MEPAPLDDAADPCFAGGGECGALMRQTRWSETPLGPSRAWPRTLRTLVPIMLASRFAMRLLWGPQMILLYNDRYRAVLGPRKHPRAMGRPIEESYRELWSTVGPMFARVMGGEAVDLDDGILPLYRAGYLEECYFTLSYSPIRDDEGGDVRGVLGVVHETTERVLAERRLVALRQLAADLTDVTTVDDAFRRAGEALARNNADVPFALFYLTEPGEAEARLVASSGLGAGRLSDAAVVGFAGEDAAWPLRAASDGHAPVVVDDLGARFGEIHAGPFPEAVTRAVVLPLVRPSERVARAFVVAGVNPRHDLDEQYRAFFELVAQQVGTALFGVVARDEERANALALARAAQDAERAAEAERLRLYELFMQAPMPVAIVRGPALLMELANDAALATWGKTRDILGKPFLDGFPEMRGQGFDTLLEGVLATGVAHRGSETLTRLARGHASLDEVYWNFVYTPLLEGSRVTGVLVCGFEVTDQVVARRRVERLADELANQKTALENAHRLKDEFVATMSHELRTPLNAILGWTRMLKLGRVAPARTPHALETIERNVVAQTALIDDLLDVSRILTGKLRLNVEPVDLAQVVEATLETLRPACDARDIQVHAVIDSHAGPIFGDRDRLSQIVTNLVSNAVKFSPKGSRIQVCLERVNSVLRLTVKDGGKGIAPEFLPFVFERFRQADQTTSRQHGGLGLGLSIVKHLVELHGGTVVAHSDGVGRGATFTVTIPLAAVQAPRPAGVEAVAATPEARDPSRELAGLRVLVVDDEVDARELIAEILSSAGVEVRTAGNAAAALREVEHFVPHVLVCDIGMPGEDGYSLMQRIRALPADRGGRLGAAAVTAYTRGEDRRRALAVGFNLHLSKPLDPSELIVSVARLAGRYPG